MDKEIQVSNNLEDNLCEDEPNEEYWKELAKEREKALNDTLEENRSLCELIQGNDQPIIPYQNLYVCYRCPFTNCDTPWDTHATRLSLSHVS